MTVPTVPSCPLPRSPAHRRIGLGVLARARASVLNILPVSGILGLKFRDTVLIDPPAANTGKFHIPTALVVAQEALDVESSSRLDFLLLHNLRRRFIA
jgi:hypothetical protein